MFTVLTAILPSSHHTQTSGINNNQVKEQMLVVRNSGQFWAQALFAHVSSVLHLSGPAFSYTVGHGMSFQTSFVKRDLYGDYLWNRCPLSSSVPLPLKLHCTHLHQWINRFCFTWCLLRMLTRFLLQVSQARPSLSI